MKPKTKIVCLVVLLLVLIVLGVIAYERTMFFSCKTNCSIKMEQEYKELKNKIK